MPASHVSPLAASLIRGCHPTFSSKPCNDDWFLVSILDYYRVHSHQSHPHPGKYWRFTFDMKWGWKESITDFKTQSVKEYILISKILRSRQREIHFHLLCVQRAFKQYSNTEPIGKLIASFLYFPTLKQLIQHELAYLPPIRLPSIHHVNPLQIFFGRCYQYCIFHRNTTTCILNTRVDLCSISQYCRVMPRPCIIHPQLMIHNKSSFFYLLRCILKEDQQQYKFPNLSKIHEACHYNLSGIENSKYYTTFPTNDEYLKRPSMIDAWLSDLFGW